MTTATPPAKSATKDMAKADKQPSQLSTLKGWLESPAFAGSIAKVLPTHLKPERFIRIAITATMKNPKLLQCTQASMFECLLRLSEAGLEPDGRRAHLIPRDVRKKVGSNWVVDHTDCTLVIDYKGLAELVMRSGMVSNIHADVICENDEFMYDKGFIERHRVDFRRPRGRAYAAYAVVRFKDGTEKCEVMSEEEILAIRDRSEGWKAFIAKRVSQSPWNPDEPTIAYEMWKKTVFRRLTKWVPLSAEIRDVVAAEDDYDDVSAQAQVASSQVLEGTVTSKSDALADMLQQRMQESSPDSGEQEPPEPEPGDQNSEEVPTTDPPSEPVKEESAPTLADLMARVAESTRITELHEINDIGKKFLSPEDWDKLGMALHEHGQMIEQAKQEAAKAAKGKDGKLL